jgi:hypothetical protein
MMGKLREKLRESLQNQNKKKTTSKYRKHKSTKKVKLTKSNLKNK